MFDEKVVVRFIDGRTLQGYGDTFMPFEEEIMVKDSVENILHVRLDEVKLICFVKRFDSQAGETHKPSPPLQFVAVPGRKIFLRFKDGETIRGMASIEAPPIRGFFLTPLNPNSNNRQLYVNPKALDSFRFES
jgi:hypothetical protein